MRIKSLEDKVKQEEKYELFGDDLDIVDIYENCLKGFKYEKNLPSKNQKNNYKVIANCNEQRIFPEGKHLKENYFFI